MFFFFSLIYVPYPYLTLPYLTLPYFDYPSCILVTGELDAERSLPVWPGFAPDVWPTPYTREQLAWTWGGMGHWVVKLSSTGYPSHPHLHSPHSLPLPFPLLPPLTIRAITITCRVILPLWHLLALEPTNQTPNGTSHPQRPSLLSPHQAFSLAILRIVRCIVHRCISPRAARLLEISLMDHGKASPPVWE